ncbi:MAG: ATP-binding protein [Burkholderiales bacterium]
MNWVFGTWIAVASMCVTLAIVHVYLWLRQPRAVGSAAFVALALSVAGMGYLEARMMLAASIAEFGRFLWWYQLPVWSGLVALVCFVRFYLRAGRAWLGWLAIGLRTAALVFNAFMSPSIQFREITSLAHVTVLDAPLAIARGVPNPLLLVAQGALLVTLVFLVDATRDMWRHGHRHRAAFVGGSLLLFVTAGTAQALVSYWGLAAMPVFASLLFLPIVLAMAAELARDLFNGIKLGQELADKRAEVEHMSRVATLTELSGTLAHEINQPLGIIMSNAEAAQRLLEKGHVDVAELREIMHDIVQADERASQVIERLRAMLRRRAPERQPVEVDALVADVLRFMRADIARRGVTVEPALGAAGARVDADRVSLEQVLVNLIANACDAMEAAPAGGRVLAVASSSDTGSAVVRISDRGRGLPDPPERVFTPFYTTKSEGLGMGLAISRSIVTAHGGRLSAQRNAHGGATLVVELPAMQGNVA